MGGEGFEPPKAKPTDLQSVLVDHLSIRPKWVPAGGRGGKSTVETAASQTTRVLHAAIVDFAPGSARAARTSTQHLMALRSRPIIATEAARPRFDLPACIARPAPMRTRFEASIDSARTLLIAPRPHADRPFRISGRILTLYPAPRAFACRSAPPAPPQRRRGEESTRHAGLPPWT